MKLFGRKDKGPKVNAVHIAGGFSPAVPEQTQSYVREQALENMIRLKPNFADLWERAKRSPKNWSVMLIPSGDDDLDELRFQVSTALAMAAQVDLNTLSQASGRHFWIDGKAELPDNRDFIWCIQVYFVQ